MEKGLRLCSESEPLKSLNRSTAKRYFRSVCFEVNRNSLFVTVIGSQYGQFSARSMHKSPCFTALCNLFVIEFLVICADVSMGSLHTSLR